LAKWKLFDQSKNKEDAEKNHEAPPEQSDELTEKPTMPSLREESKERPIKEYNETLYAKDAGQKPSQTPSFERKQTIRRTSWESSEMIEHNIDSLAGKQREVAGDAQQKGNDVNKKVDFILIKKKGRH